ncbi:MAG: Xaa-Pro peptidase family protein [Endomicrobium sp.]|jgi:Xaa-Pro aminopeptidase|uniref:M24 family metallopeptidase n=1 Tax=Candidatus Endomicrobiellum cubanum TaxID=3242325 RepID=UPI0028319CA1|nr:Xaa-Pro peptidase family protein [Endomicrobium sp.]
MNKKNLQIFHNIPLDTILFTNQKDIFYLTGVPFDGFWFLCTKNGYYAICSKMIENQVKNFFVKSKIKVWPYTPFHESVATILRKNSINNVTVDPTHISASDFILLNNALTKKQIKLEKKVGILTSSRIIKNDNEIASIKKACQIVSEVCNTIKKELKPGLSEIDIYYKILELFAKKQVTESFSPIVACGVNSANPHHKSSNTKIKENDIVLLDIGCSYNGYCSDLTRTYFLDKIGREERVIWNTVKAAQDAVLCNLKAGQKISWADKTAREVIKKAGFGDRFIHSTGHGVGVEIHEMPSLSSNIEGVFLPNMIVTVEPGVYIDDKFGVRIEDTVLVKETGCEILTCAIY